MRREIIIRTSGGRVLTGNGLLPVAGNVGFKPGEAVYVFDGHLIGQQRTQGRPKVYISSVAPTPQASEFLRTDFLFAARIFDLESNWEKPDRWSLYLIKCHLSGDTLSEVSRYQVPTPDYYKPEKFVCSNDASKYSIIWGFANYQMETLPCLLQHDTETPTVISNTIDNAYNIDMYYTTDGEFVINTEELEFPMGPDYYATDGTKISISDDPIADVFAGCEDDRYVYALSTAYGTTEGGTTAYGWQNGPFSLYRFLKADGTFDNIFYFGTSDDWFHFANVRL